MASKNIHHEAARPPQLTPGAPAPMGDGLVVSPTRPPDAWGCVMRASCSEQPVGFLTHYTQVNLHYESIVQFYQCDDFKFNLSVYGIKIYNKGRDRLPKTKLMNSDHENSKIFSFFFVNEFFCM